MSKKKYTVLLAYPDYIAQSRDWGDTFSAHVAGENPEEAVAGARKVAGSANGFDQEPDAAAYSNLEDFTVVAVYKGWLDDLNPEALW